MGFPWSFPQRLSGTKHLSPGHRKVTLQTWQTWVLIFWGGTPEPLLTLGTNRPCGEGAYRMSKD